MFYNPQALLATIDANWLAVLAGGSIAMVFNYIFFWEAGRSAMRDSSPAFPLIACTIWFAHDLSFVLQYDAWFNLYDHWYLKLFWAALIPTTLFEGFYTWQAWRYGRAEFFPSATQGQWTAYVLGALALACLSWWAIKQLLDDPLYTWSFATTGALAAFFCLARAVRRGDGAGQSVLLWVSFCVMTAAWFTCEYVVFGGMFRHPLFVGIGVTSVICALLMIRICRQARVG
jgi:hypothetical protein